MFIAAFVKELQKRDELIRERVFCLCVCFLQTGTKGMGSSRIGKGNCFSTLIVKINLRNKTYLKSGLKCTNRHYTES